MKFLFLLFIFGFSSFASDFSYRKYAHVKNFYEELTPSALEIAKKYKIPPAALLAMSGLESGYDSGYVGQITGNILSLGAYKSDTELPSLYLPWCDQKKAVLYDAKDIKQCPKEQLHYKQRPKSLKRDYRPAPYAGTTQNLEYFKYHKKEKAVAHYQCLEDFSTRWIRADASIKAFANARIWLDTLIQEKGEEVLYLESTNRDFIHKIGGVPHSFNYRETWPKKVILIMHKVGLVELTYKMHHHKKSFKEAWLMPRVAH
jgi:hypothetical protein